MTKIVAMLAIALAAFSAQVQAQTQTKTPTRFGTESGGGGHVVCRNSNSSSDCVWYDTLTGHEPIPEFPDSPTAKMFYRVYRALENYGFAYWYRDSGYLEKPKKGDALFRATVVLPEIFFERRYVFVDNLPAAPECQRAPDIAGSVDPSDTVKQVACTIGRWTFIDRKVFPRETSPTTPERVAMFLHESARGLGLRPNMVYKLGRAAVIFTKQFLNEDQNLFVPLAPEDRDFLQSLSDDFWRVGRTSSVPGKSARQVHIRGGGIFLNDGHQTGRYNEIYVNPLSRIEESEIFNDSNPIGQNVVLLETEVEAWRGSAVYLGQGTKFTRCKLKVAGLPMSKNIKEGSSYEDCELGAIRDEYLITPKRR